MAKDDYYKNDEGTEAIEEAKKKAGKKSWKPDLPLFAKQIAQKMEEIGKAREQMGIDPEDTKIV